MQCFHIQAPLRLCREKKKKKRDEIVFWWSDANSKSGEPARYSATYVSFSAGDTAEIAAVAGFLLDELSEHHPHF